MAATLLALVASPALAARKVFEIRIQNLTEPLEDPLLGTICGVNDDFTAVITLNQIQLVIWDNGRSLFSESSAINIFDSGGALIATDRFAGHVIEGPGSLPFTSVLNLMARCAPESGAPGLFCGFHFTLTISEDGSVRADHGVEPPFSCFTE